MAYFGLRYPVIAKNVKGVYSDGFRCAKAVSTEVTPNYVEGSQYGDDTQCEYEKAFSNASVKLGTTSLPTEAASVMFGHTVDSTKKTVSYKATDEPNNVGVGFVVDEVVEGVVTYVATIIKCVKFGEPTDSFATKADSITFSNPTVEGVAIADTDGQWKTVTPYTTAEEALAAINTAFSITPEG